MVGEASEVAMECSLVACEPVEVAELV